MLESNYAILCRYRSCIAMVVMVGMDDIHNEAGDEEVCIGCNCYQPHINSNIQSMHAMEVENGGVFQEKSEMHNKVRNAMYMHLENTSSPK